MRYQRLQTQRCECRSKNRCGKYICCGRRHAHTEDEAYQHTQHETEQQMVLSDIDDHAGELHAEATLRYQRDGYLSSRKKSCHRQDTRRALHRSIEAELSCILDHLLGVAGAEQTADSIGHQTDQCAVERTLCYREAHRQKSDEYRQRDEDDQSLVLVDLVLTHLSVDLQTLGYEMQCYECALIVEDSRYDSRLCHAQIRDAYQLCHDERAAAHDGRHDLTAGRSDRTDRCRPLLVISRLAHHRNGKCTCRYDIGHRRSRYHTEERRRDERYLAGTADSLSCQLLSDLDKCLATAGLRQNGSEYTECREHTCGKPDHLTPYTVSRMIEIPEDSIKAEVLVTP